MMGPIDLPPFAIDPRLAGKPADQIIADAGRAVAALGEERHRSRGNDVPPLHGG